eukprot:scaffold18247_cov102-Skeletonema_dohrnii-CCMP3373.AAC.3
MTAATTTSRLARDPSSLSNPDQAHITHLFWDASINFDEQLIIAKATYTVQLVGNNNDDPSSVKNVKLDTSHLDIHSVYVNDTPATFSMTVPDHQKSHLGSCLEIQLLDNTQSTITITISYTTTKQCSAAQWLPPAQTAGKQHPYIFTQCQAIHARSLLPCMDCPSVKFEYEARVSVPEWATCVMSALSKDGPSNNAPPPPPSINDDNTTTTTTFHFHQPTPIPSYLFALAVGQLSSMDISPRCRVWSEPSMVAAVAFEFAQVEQFLEVAEELTLEYQWGRYDILCLPPSFPYGGMENPCLTFVTPTLLAGDRSLADVVAHEAAHSWSGNLVTNETWEHFWLNEGWTVFLQRKIMAKVYNDDKFFDFDAIGGWKDLKDSVEEMPDAYTKLIPELGDGDPDDAFSSIPYEKGFNLLYSLERMVGKDKFGEFTKAYFNEFKFGVITSEKFQNFFESYFEGIVDVSSFDWETWLHQPGMPEEPIFDRTLSAECDELAKAWISLDEIIEGGETPSTNISDWSTAQTVTFLDALTNMTNDRSKPLSLETIQSMKEAYNMQQSKNSEVLHRFCMLAVAAGDSGIIPTVIRFITTQGRMKFVRPLYRALYKSEMGKEIAVKTFLENREFYHPIASKMVATDMSVGKTEEDGESKSKKKGISLMAVGAVIVVAAAVGIALRRGKR